MGLDVSHAIMLGLGFFFGALVFNENFRKRFFKGLRKFLANLGQGAQSANRRAGGRK